MNRRSNLIIAVVVLLLLLLLNSGSLHAWMHETFDIEIETVAKFCGQISFTGLGLLIPILIAALFKKQEPDVPNVKPLPEEPVAQSLGKSEAQEMRLAVEAELARWQGAYGELRAWADKTIEDYETVLRRFKRARTLLKYSFIAGVLLATVDFLALMYFRTLPSVQWYDWGLGIPYAIIAFMISAYLAGKLTKHSQIPILVGAFPAFYVNIAALLIFFPRHYTLYFGPQCNQFFGVESGTLTVLLRLIALPLVAGAASYLACLIVRNMKNDGDLVGRG